jgi:hypothetical protein
MTSFRNLPHSVLCIQLLLIWQPCNNKKLWLQIYPLWPLGHKAEDLGSQPFLYLGSTHSTLLDLVIQWCLHKSTIRHQFIFVCTADISGLYYKHMTIVNDDSSVVSEQSFYLIDNARGTIYNHRKFIIQATGVEKAKLWVVNIGS